MTEVFERRGKAEGFVVGVTCDMERRLGYSK